MGAFKRGLSLAVLSLLVITSPVDAIGRGNSDKVKKHKYSVKVEYRKNDYKNLKDRDERKREQRKREDYAHDKEFELRKEELEIRKKELEIEKEITLKELELKKEINKNKFEIKKEKLKLRRIELKARMKKMYSKNEMENIDKQEKYLREIYKDIKVLPVENIMSKKGKLKFDTPPVIKSGRTLIPVRAISQGFGADVTWKGESREVVISKDGKEIILKIGSNIAIVDGEEIEFDSRAEIMNGRTIVPLRFIAENLGLRTDYDEETETIEISDEEDIEDIEDIEVEDIYDDSDISDEDMDNEEDIENIEDDSDISDEDMDNEEDIVEETTEDGVKLEDTTVEE